MKSNVIILVSSSIFATDVVSLSNDDSIGLLDVSRKHKECRNPTNCVTLFTLYANGNFTKEDNLTYTERNNKNEYSIVIMYRLAGHAVVRDNS